MNKNYWKRLGREFTEYALLNDFNKLRTIKIEHTSLFPIHTVGRGPNINEPSLLDFSTRLIEAKRIHFYMSKYGSVEVFYAAVNESSNKVFFEVRKNNKNTVFTYSRNAESHEHARFLQDLLKDKEGTYVEGNENEIELILKEQGFSIITCFAYSNKVVFNMPHHSGGCIRPKYVKILKNGIEIGWNSVGTHNAIPNVLRITKSRGIKTESLSNLGIETSGYYGHYYKCKILASQVKQAKAFFSSRFKGLK